MSHVVVDANGCWLWQGRKNPNGYGISMLNGSGMGAHRASFLAFRGVIPAGLELDHRCKVRRCINPDHLEPVTHAENVRRSALASAALEAGRTLGRAASAAKRRSRTHCPARASIQRREYTNDRERMARLSNLPPPAGKRSSVNHREWHEAWCLAWSQVSWLASTDILQTQFMVTIERVARSVTVAIREIQSQVRNFEVRLEGLGDRVDWAIKASGAAKPAKLAKKGKRR